MGRVSTFADPEIIKLATKEFVPVAADDWYQRRRQDEEGAFFLKVANQGPRNKPGETRQGIYVLTASGKLLAYRNSTDPKVMRAVLQDGLRKWNALPEAERQPNAVEIAPNKLDPNFARTPPPGGLVVNVHTRILDRDADGAFCKGECGVLGGDRAALDHLWLREADWKALVPVGAKQGDTFAVPPDLAYRLARFHMMDNTRGEGPVWQIGQVRKIDFRVSVVEVSAEAVRLKLEGSVLLATDADVGKAARGFDANVLGHLRYHVKKQALERFDVVVLGEHWGEGPFTKGSRPGRSLLGVAFELAGGNGVLDQIPPQGSRWLQGYWNANRE